MPKTRREVAQTVADTFLPLEMTVQNTAADAARCVATLIEQRMIARLPLTYGAEAIAFTSEAAQHLVLAANAFANAHSYLHALSDKIGIERAYGPESPPEETGVLQTAAQLHLVKAKAA
jgi:hypothetical protein